MEAVTAFATRRLESLTDASPIPTGDSGRALAVKATYLLSEEGRKASLLAGGDGRAVQDLTVQVPANRLHLVSVDADGIARLKLRPSYRLDGEQSVVRVDSPPTYDAPPDIEELFREAARNHQLERSYHSERRATRSKRRDAERERRAALATAFLADPKQRALLHPPPTPQRCHLATEHGRLLFDARNDESPAREVPAEAHRRFRADLRAQKERNQQERTAQLALHEEKKRVIADWIVRKGTSEQQARQAAGMLPMQEAVEAMTDEAFGVLRDRQQYTRDGDAHLQAHLRLLPQYADAVITKADVLPMSANAHTATAEQFALVAEFQGALPNATIALRVHKVSWRRDPQVMLPPGFSILVTQRVGPFTLRREYAAPSATQ
jgi:hypothetical protein